MGKPCRTPRPDGSNYEMLLSDQAVQRIKDSMANLKPPTSGEILVNLRLSFSNGGYRGLEIEVASTANFSAAEAPMK